MAVNFNFRQAETIKDFDRLRLALLEQPLNYRGYLPWVGRAMDEVFSGYKEAMLAFYDNYLIGYLLSQPSKTTKGFREMKSARVLEEFQRRLVLSFMMRWEEVEAKKAGNLAMICDTRLYDVANLLRCNGYREIARADLYHEGFEDIVFAKPLVSLTQNSKASLLFMPNGLSRVA